MAARKVAEKLSDVVAETQGETVETARKTRDTTPVAILSDFVEVSGTDVPVSVRKRSDNPFREGIAMSYDNDYANPDIDKWVSVQVDNVARAARQVHTAATDYGVGSTVLVRDETGATDRTSSLPGTIWFRGKTKTDRKSSK